MNKMTAAKAALKQVLKSVPERTHIGLLVFSAKDLNDDWVYPLGPRDDARLILSQDPELTSSRGEALKLLLYLFECDEAVRLFRAA